MPATTLKDIAAALFVAWFHDDKQRGLDIWAQHKLRELPPADLDEIRTEFKAACARQRDHDAHPPQAGQRQPLKVPLSNFREGGIAQRALEKLNPNRTAVHHRWRQEDEQRLWARLERAEEKLAMAYHVNDHDSAATLERLVEVIKGMLRTVGTHWPAERARDGHGITPAQLIATNRRLYARAVAVRDFLDSGEELPELPTNEQLFERLRNPEYLRSLSYSTQQLFLEKKRGPHEHATAFAVAMIRRCQKAGIPVFCTSQQGSVLVIEHCEWGASLTDTEHRMIALSGKMSARALNLAASWQAPSTWIIGQADSAIDYGALLKVKALDEFLDKRAR